ncbi:hypothetical protein TVAG_345470 [Trichomonas vaginalis G3]|uniref:Uncharacterized protein n=1 Tax=Trichomonas vaginalis (strain ATCC PRA-98 / G3) TaxID=412133 RepID=A2EW25_TRIV3|nr:hypothetical protein TVAGG3_0120780 [Trichomonas vaginalis G3]EAY03173.1 hypothetical protein TVAG_345470 [Trichomonas vaginalis G3]KAI5545461.1 hypothetical protein TVAGG3_0120780 [Trichomonas vaginalis G3]|eukprot:XP_001315396.1 hypothetical protein [Trichomonas vaginalis G3]
MNDSQIGDLKRALQAAEARVNVLENELSKKTEVLENTEAVLSSSQQQYKELLMRLSEMSQQQKTAVDETKLIELQKQVDLCNAQIEKQTSVISDQREKIELLQLENEKLKQSLQFYSEKFTIQVPRNTEDRIQKSIYQLRQAQEDILDLRAENENLKYQISHNERENKSWEEFGYDIYHELSSFVDIVTPIPRDNPRLLRLQLRDLIQKATDINSHKERYYRNEDCEYKYNSAKKSLREVQTRCDHMLGILGEEPSFKSHQYYQQQQRYYSDPPQYHSSTKYDTKTKRYESTRSNTNYRSDSVNDQEIATKENKAVSSTTKLKENTTTLKKKHDTTNTNELNRCIHELHGITKQIKCDYQKLFE